VASRSIALALKGVPGIYTHGAVALPNDHELVKRTGLRRDVNRGMIDPEMFREQLHQPGSKRYLLRLEQRTLLRSRTSNRAFHPQGQQRVLRPHKAIFTLLRVSPEGDRHVLAMTNVTGEPARVEFALEELGVADIEWHDVVSGESYLADDDRLSLTLYPYDVTWLIPESEHGD
jgi:sucrose phosphorylase